MRNIKLENNNSNGENNNNNDNDNNNTFPRHIHKATLCNSPPERFTTC